jgi:hypothetical protein
LRVDQHGVLIGENCDPVGCKGSPDGRTEDELGTGIARLKCEFMPFRKTCVDFTEVNIKTVAGLFEILAACFQALVNDNDIESGARSYPGSRQARGSGADDEYIRAPLAPFAGVVTGRAALRRYVRRAPKNSDVFACRFDAGAPRSIADENLAVAANAHAAEDAAPCALPVSTKTQHAGGD